MHWEGWTNQLIYWLIDWFIDWLLVFKLIWNWRSQLLMCPRLRYMMNGCGCTHIEWNQKWTCLIPFLRWLLVFFMHKDEMDFSDSNVLGISDSLRMYILHSVDFILTQLLNRRTQVYRKWWRCLIFRKATMYYFPSMLAFLLSMGERVRMNQCSDVTFDQFSSTSRQFDRDLQCFLVFSPFLPALFCCDMATVTLMRGGAGIWLFRWRWN